MFYIEGVGYVSNDAAFTLPNGSQKAAGWFRGKTPEQIAAIGAVPVTYGPKPDERYYWVTEHRNGAEITYTGTLRDDVLAMRLRDLAAYRWGKETAGIIVNGAVVNTERDSRAMITGAALAATLDANYTVKWKAANGWVDLDAAAIIGLATAMRMHVQSCFNIEALHETAMRALADAEDWEALITYDFTAPIDENTDWPETASAA